MRKRYTIKKFQLDGDSETILISDKSDVIKQTTTEEEANIEKVRLERIAYKENFMLFRYFLHKDGYSNSMSRYNELSKLMLEKYGFNLRTNFGTIKFHEVVTDEVLDFMREKLEIEFYEIIAEDKPMSYFIPKLNPAVIVDACKGSQLLKEYNEGIYYFFTYKEAVFQMAKYSCNLIEKSYRIKGTLEELSYTPDLLKEFIDQHENIYYEDEFLYFRRCNFQAIAGINDLLIDCPIIVEVKESLTSN